MSLPYFPMFPTDFEAKTSHLTLEEDGAYNRLLRLMWMTPGCSLPDDDAWIMRRMRVDADTYERVVRVVIEEFCDRENGRVSNAKLTRIFAESEARHSRRVEAGAKGGKAKALKNKDSGSSNDKAKLKQPEPEPEPLREDTSVSSSRKPSRDEGFADFWDAWPSKKNKQDALKAWRKLPIEAKREAYRAVIHGWFERWQAASPDANPIHASTFLNKKRWEDTHSPQLLPINGGLTNAQCTHQHGGTADRPQNRPDPALEQIARLAGLGQAPGNGGR